MIELRKAAEMALEALEMTKVVFKVDDRDYGLSRVSNAAEALRQALAQSKKDGVVIYRTGYESGYMDASVASNRDGDAINMTQERVDETAKRKQKPVAWIKAKELELMRGFIGTSQRDWRTNLGLEKWDEEDVPLYTAPPKHEWVGLTDEEIDEIYKTHHDQYGKCKSGGFEYEKTIEAKLKEKNT